MSFSNLSYIYNNLNFFSNKNALYIIIRDLIIFNNAILNNNKKIDILIIIFFFKVVFYKFLYIIFINISLIDIIINIIRV